MDSRRNTWAAFAAAVLLQGCMVGPDYRRPEVAEPPAWVSLDATPRPDVESVPVAGTPDVAEWWTQFNDPVLSGLITRAASGNLSLAAAEARLRQARAARMVAGSGLYPQLDASASYTYAHAAASQFGNATNDLYLAGFDATWEIDIFGGLRRGVEAANAGIDSAFFDREAVLVSVAAEVAAAYFDLRGSQRALVISQENLAAQQETLQVTEERFNAGFVGTLDVANARSQVAQTASVIPSFDARAQSDIFALSVLLGLEPGALLEELTPVQPIPAAPAQVPVGLPSDLLLRRPDLRRAEADLHAATAQVGVAVADAYPKFSLTGSFATSGGSVASLGNIANHFWAIGPAVSMPLFTGGRVKGNIEQARAVTDEALAAYRAAVLTALQDVETALVSFTREQERRAALVEAEAAARQAQDSALELYTAGRTDFLNVLTAQGRLFAIQAELTQSQAAIGSDLVALYKALGGGWDVEGSSS